MYMVSEQKKAPKVGSALDSGKKLSNLRRQSIDNGLWSQQRPPRERELMNALYGTEHMYKPGLEMLEDKYDWITEKLEQELEEKKRGG